MKTKQELLQTVELRQHKYLNNLVELSALGNQVIDESRNGIWVIHHGKTNTKEGVTKGAVAERVKFIA